ncbi:MAG: SDR family NAD(P)-dependent oxidoreductase [Sphingomonadales bacterium]|nr:MAG: SDR family NAD(P)-dependent oxidoreductase [Sphingomonadales bacterium]
MTQKPLNGPLSGKLALVTGASRGIGAATALCLAQAGAHVVLTARTEGGLAEVDDRIHTAGGTATLAPFDLTDGEAVDRLADAIGQRWGRLDILVLNAAMLGALSPVAHVAPKDFDKIMALNLTAGFRVLRACDPLLRLAPTGRVLALTTSVARSPRAYWGPYAASKAALETLIDCYAEEVGSITGIRCAIVDPGATRTAMRAEAYPGEDPTRLKDPEAVGLAILNLLVEDFETGCRLRVDTPRS